MTDRIVLPEGQENKVRDTMRTMIDVLNTATKAYDEGRPIMTDEEWDNYYFDLLTLEEEVGFALSDSPTQKISYEVVSKLEKVTHSHKMLSLDKTKNLSVVDSFLGSNLFIAMCKMDGLTCSLHYHNGFLVSAETRGNGIEGENILHNARVIPSIPNHINYDKDLTVDGEIICTYKKFEKFAQEYKNPRNFAAGSVRLLDSKECEARNLKFVAWDVIEGLENRISHFKKDENEKVIVDESQWFEEGVNNYLCEKLMDLAKLGFTIVPWYSRKFDMSENISSLTEVVEYLQKQAVDHSYPIDGIVFKFDNIEYGKSLGATAHHFKNAIAYKFYDEVYDTTLKYIDWTMGRTGILTPVAVFKPVEIDGAIVERASMHNYGVMRELLGECAYVGEPLKVYRANQIIPQLKPVEENARFNYGYVVAHGGVSANDEPEWCPICGGPCSTQKSSDGILNKVCENPQCKGKFINILDHFAGKKGLDIKGISESTLEKLIEWGWVENIEDIFNLRQYEKEWSSKQGFGKKSVQKILDAIDESKNCTFESFISAIGIPLVGPAVAKNLAQIVNNSYEQFRELVNKKYNFAQIPTFGGAKADAILNFDYTEADKIYNNYLKMRKIDESEESMGPQLLTGKIFVITGKLHKYKNRMALVQVIEAYGGRVANSVSTKTSYLINNDINSNSAKNIAAKGAGIPIITEDEFDAMLSI